MQLVSKEFKEAVKGEKVTATAKVTITDTNETLDGNVLQELSITDFCYDNGKLIGTTASKMLECKVVNKYNVYNLADKDIKLDVGVEVPFGQEEVQVEDSDINIQRGVPNTFKFNSLNGKIEQQTTSGKNLYDKNWRDFSAAYLTELEDGWIQFTANNTTSQTKYANFFTKKNNLLKTNIVYTYILEVKDNAGDNPKIDLGETGSLSQFTSEKIIEINNSQNIYSAKMTTKNDFTGLNACGRDFIFIAGNKSYNLKFRVSLIEGEIDINNFVYEQYTGGKPSPSPEYPQEIKTVTGDVEVKVHTKNMLPSDANDTTWNGITIKNNHDGSYTLNGTSTQAGSLPITLSPNNIHLFKGNYYTQSITEISGTKTGGRVVPSVKNKNNEIKYNYLTDNQSKLADDDYIFNTYNFYFQDAGVTLNNYTFKVQLEEGSTATPYVPHEKQSVTLPLGDIQLCGDDTVKDYIDGDIDNWHLNKNWAGIVLDGSENWDYVSSYNYFKCPTYNYGPNLPKPSGNICTHFEVIKNWLVFRDSITMSALFWLEEASNKISIRNTNFSGVEEFKQWLSENNVKVLYQLKTPTRTKITDPALVEALNKLSELQIYDDVTYITVTSGEAKGILNVTYKEKVTGQSIEYVPYGNYKVKKYEDTKSNSRYNLVAYDYMDRLNKPYVEIDGFPMLLHTFYEKFAEQYELDVEMQPNLPNWNFEIKEKPFFGENTTGRQVLSRIAEMFGSFTKINRKNNIQMYLKTDTDEKITRNEMNSKLERNEIYGPINTLVLKQTVFDGENVSISDYESIEEYGETEFSIVDNPFIYSEELRNIAISELFERLSGFRYYPTKFNYKSYLYLDNGDKFDVQDMNTNNMYESIVLNQIIRIPKTRQSSIETPALTKTQTEYKNYSIKEKIARAEARVDKANSEIKLLTSTTKELDTTINNNYIEIQNKFDGYTPVSKTAEIENSVTQIQTSTYTKTQIDTKLIDGSVTKVKSTSSTFDENGVLYEKTGSKSKIRVGFEEENEGVIIKDSGNKELMFAGYDDRIKETIVRTENLTVKKYLVVSDGRFEKYLPTNISATKGVGFFIL